MSDFQPMYVRLPMELHAAVKNAAERNERTMAQTIRFALRQHLDPVDWREVALVLFDNAHRCDADYFLTVEQRRACEQALDSDGRSEP